MVLLSPGGVRLELTRRERPVHVRPAPELLSRDVVCGLGPDIHRILVTTSGSGRPLFATPVVHVRVLALLPVAVDFGYEAGDAAAVRTRALVVVDRRIDWLALVAGHLLDLSLIHI